MQASGYNERLFSGKGLRYRYHIWRFKWLESRARKYVKAPIRLIEIGCFDGRALDHLPETPELYAGFDADWEGGLTEGQRKHASDPNIRFIKSTSPADLEEFADNTFNMGLAMETMEHIQPDLVDSYLSELARLENGYVLISVPNEKGIVFFAKHIAKQLVGARSGEKYSFSEFVNASLGRMSYVERGDHKGFDHAALRRQIAEHFDIVEVSGGPFSGLPASLNLTVAVVARSRQHPPGGEAA